MVTCDFHQRRLREHWCKLLHGLPSGYIGWIWAKQLSTLCCLAPTWWITCIEGFTNFWQVIFCKRLKRVYKNCRLNIKGKMVQNEALLGGSFWIWWWVLPTWSGQGSMERSAGCNYLHGMWGQVGLLLVISAVFDAVAAIGMIGHHILCHKYVSIKNLVWYRGSFGGHNGVWSSCTLSMECHYLESNSRLANGATPLEQLPLGGRGNPIS